METTSLNHQVDIFNNSYTVPTAGINKSVLLFDNFNGINPLYDLANQQTYKLWQTTMLFILQGQTELKINKEVINLHAGQCLTTQSDVNLVIQSSSENLSYMLYVIYPETFMKTFEDLKINYNLTNILGNYHIKSLSDEDLKYQFTLYLNLRDELLRPHYEMKATFARCYLDVLFATNKEMFDIKETITGDTSSRQYDIYKRFLIDLNQYADKERTVGYYAKLQNISAKYLSFVCVQYSKKNASTWIDEYVVTKAKALINLHHPTTQELCAQLNFSSASSFIRYFKRVTGMSPREYANSTKR